MANKIFFLADASNPHMIKWIRSLAKHNYEIVVFSLGLVSPELYQLHSNVNIVSADFDFKFLKSGHGAWKKILYLRNILRIRKLIHDFQPNIVHAHFASSYGLLAYLSGAKYLVSVWGSDVYDFPIRSPLHSWVLSRILNNAERVFSTSHVMASQTKKYTRKPIEVIPFGVDLSLFCPSTNSRGEFVTIGTVKSLELKYGIRYLIEAFEIVRKEATLPVKLLIVGKGPEEQNLKILCQKLGLHDVEFTGWVPVEKVPEFQNQLDIAVFPSILDSESFGVSVIEASACERPVIASRKGGLVEVIEENQTGILVRAEDPQALADAILKLVSNPKLRKEMGEKGRRKVESLYNWEKNLQDMIKHYNLYLNS